MSGKDTIRRAYDEARVLSDGGAAEDGDYAGPERDDDGDAPAGPPPAGVDGELVRRCAALDLSDTDNAERLRTHFGGDLVVVSLDENAGGVWAVWDGRRWDRENGAAGSLKLAQRIGPRIALEAEYLAATEGEQALLDKAEALADDDKSAKAKAAREIAAKVGARIEARQRRRFAFAVSSKNAARVHAMLTMAAPHLRRPASGFNQDPLLLVTETHSLRFVVEEDLDCPDPTVTRKKARVEARPEFRREDYVTGVAPCAYDPQAKAPKFEAFLDTTMPDRDLRRTLRVYCAGGLLGVLEQKLMYHFGSGANGKSVFLAVLMGVIGASLSVGLPKETIMGQGERGAGQASPDLVRLLGKRMVRIDELKDNESLREDLVKRLTGGDPMVVRALFEGYLEFPNVATPHMSGNGKPKIDGTDEGIWRRILVVHWSETIPEEKRRDFHEIVADLLTERSGILNWLIAGALDYLEHGLTIAAAARQATQEYREEMDPVRDFRERCLVAAPGRKVQASRMYAAYIAWAKANGRSEFSAARVGRELKRWMRRDDSGSVRFYLDVELSGEAAALVDGGAPPASWEERSGE